MSHRTVCPDPENENRVQREAIRHSITTFGALYQQQCQVKGLATMNGNDGRRQGQGFRIPPNKDTTGIYATLPSSPPKEIVLADIVPTGDVSRVVRHHMSCCRACSAFFPTTTPYFHCMATFHRKLTKSGGDAPSPWCFLFLPTEFLAQPFSEYLRPCLTTLPVITTVRYQGQYCHPKWMSSTGLDLNGRIFIEHSAQISQWWCPCSDPDAVAGAKSRTSNSYGSKVLQHYMNFTYAPVCSLYGRPSALACKARFYIIYPLLDQMVSQYLSTDRYGPDFYGGDEWAWQTAAAYIELPDGKQPSAGLISKEAYYATAEIVIMFLCGAEEKVMPLPALRGLRRKDFLSNLALAPVLQDEIGRVARGMQPSKQRSRVIVAG